MPCTMTHSIFSEKVYEEYKDYVNLEDLKTFAQGADPFYFFKILSDKEGIGSIVHKNKTKIFFINMISYIKKNKLQNDKVVMSFLYGFISHYFLDKTAHPYIIYKSGVFNKKKKETYKYNRLHHKNEIYIDCYYINKYKKKNHKNFKIYNECFNYKLNVKLLDLIDNVFKETYKIENASKKYKKGLIKMKYTFKYVNYDSTGLKRHIYSIIDVITPKSFNNLKQASYNIELNNNDILNLKKSEWNHPSDKNEIYNYSFVELFDIALKDCIYAIKIVNEVLYNNKSITILDSVFLNLTYTTNKECNKKLSIKYFE